MSWIAPALLSILGFVEPADTPKAVDDRLVIELFAAEPDLVTPTGIAVDDRGRVLVIESHTHFRPKDYAGPPADRIRVFEDTDDDGRADRISTFFEGTRFTMNLAIYADGSVYVATRSEIFRLRDSDGDGQADERTPIARLETPGDYPHNGLSGFAFDSAGNVYFGLGENLGAKYQLIGSDGTTLTGGGEGGNIYRCRADGSRLERIATGFWNPFHLAFDADGRLFAVDNDPDSRPPCRLLHIVPGGDYGYRFRNGRKGLHPFTAWNGELPGTLPMVAGTGEAPSGVVAYESDGLPADYRAQLLVTSWGDHRLDRFQLERRGASFTSHAVPFVTGGENFRPVGIAIAPDGSLYVSDWVDKSYTLHGKGRIWHIRAKKPTSKECTADRRKHGLALPEYAATGDARAEALRRADHGAGEADLLTALHEADPFLQQAARTGLRRIKDDEQLLVLAASRDSALRLSSLLMLRESPYARARTALPQFLRDSDPAIRFAAVQWIAEAGLQEYRPQVESLLATSGTRELFEGCLAALELLDRAANSAAAPPDPNKEIAGEEYVVRLLLAEATPPAIRARALRMLRPNHPALTLDRLKGWLASPDEVVQLEALRTLRESQLPGGDAQLSELAANAALPSAFRAEAIMGLSGERSEEIERLLALAAGNDPILRGEALRSLRNVELNSDQRSRLQALAERDPAWAKLVARILHPAPATPATDTANWLRLLDGPGNAAAGERIFFHPKAAGCYRCHQIDGRGGRIGPDLTATARLLDRRRLIESIVQPSKEIAPQFVTYTLATTDGRALTGLLVSEAADGGQTYADAEGRLFTLHAADIEQRQPQQKSIMPDDLAGTLTLQEFRDLLAFLIRRM